MKIALRLRLRDHDALSNIDGFEIDINQQQLMPIYIIIIDSYWKSMTNR